MKADAIKLVAAAAMSSIEPTEKELGAALGEVVDIALAFFANVKRIADAAEAYVGPLIDPREV